MNGCSSCQAIKFFSDLNFSFSQSGPGTGADPQHDGIKETGEEKSVRRVADGSNQATCDERPPTAEAHCMHAGGKLKA
jgi:hypothetical protein